jgi:hypothetical protein
MTTPRRPLGFIDPNRRWSEELSPVTRSCEDPLLLWIHTTALKRRNGRSCDLPAVILYRKAPQGPDSSVISGMTLSGLGRHRISDALGIAPSTVQIPSTMKLARRQ